MSDIALSPPPTQSPTLTPQLYINRELSWLEFNSRVLHEAFDPRNPLLERLKFAAIFSTNLDEFYMVRVAGLRRQLAANVTVTAPDGLSPQEQLDAISSRVRELLEQQQRLIHEQLLPELADRGVRLVPLEELTAEEWVRLDDYFEKQVYPVLTPLAVDPGHPFPYISNLSLSLAVEIRDSEDGEIRFARVKVPRSLPRWIPVNGRPFHFVPLEQVIGANLGALFSGMEIVAWYCFRLTRYSDLDIPIEEPEDLLATIEEQVYNRRFGEVVRIEVQDDMPPHLRALLLEELREYGDSGAAALTERDIYDAGRLLGLSELATLAAVDIPTLKDAPFQPIVPARLRESTNMFDLIREGDIIVHHPFDSFTATVERFLEEAAADDQVLAIKLTLYRTSGDTALVDALVQAAQRGKQVAVIVELKARFDEANNIVWARQLEDAGVHVAFGSATLKTHAKVALVVRREPDGMRRYVHLGSGNYNSRTARLYTDVGLFTCSPSIGADASDLFNSLTGYSRQRIYRKLLVAPMNLRMRFLELIEREAMHAQAGRPARIVGKMNALVDADVIDALYRASQAGVDIDLIVRGICCLRPGIADVSDRIRVVSIIGRFLEHSRMWQFANGGAEEFYIGSADWMPRNFDRRVEAVAPVEAAALHVRLRSLLDTYLNDNRQSWELQSDGEWIQCEPNGVIRASHELLQRNSWGGSRDGAEPAVDVPDRLRIAGD